MNALTRRVRRLEPRAFPPENVEGLRIVAEIRERGPYRPLVYTDPYLPIQSEVIMRPKLLSILLLLRAGTVSRGSQSGEVVVLSVCGRQPKSR